MAEEIYAIPEEPVYSERIRRLQDSDPSSASLIFNPLFERIIENIHCLYRQQKARNRYVIAIRERDPAKPDYGLAGGGGEAAVLLEAQAYTGGAEVSAIVSGVEYDAGNMSAGGEDAADGTLILTKLEE